MVPQVNLKRKLAIISAPIVVMSPGLLSSHKTSEQKLFSMWVLMVRYVASKALALSPQAWASWEARKPILHKKIWLIYFVLQELGHMHEGMRVSDNMSFLDSVL